jgi:quinolinate synthase
MARLAGEHPEVVLATEAGMCERIRRLHPQCACHPLRRSAVCRNMKLTRLESVRDALAGTGGEEIAIAADVAERARRAVERMTALG